MSNVQGFAEALAHSESLTETDIAATVAWFLNEHVGAEPSMAEIVDFIERNGVRHNINTSRLRKNLQKDQRTSAPRGKPIAVKPAARRQFSDSYSQFLAAPLPRIDNAVLVAEDFLGARKYINDIVRQINGSYQFELFDACAVMMRRLAEVLIIDAYVNTKNDSHIRDSKGDYVMMNNLINALKSGRNFNLSRNAPGYLDKLKVLGDTAAHSRTYITKSKDIDDFSQSYRMLIEELSSLND